MKQTEVLPYFNKWQRFSIETYTTLHYNGIETEKIWDLVLLYAEVECNERVLIRMVYNE